MPVNILRLYSFSDNMFSHGNLYPSLLTCSLSLLCQCLSHHHFRSGCYTPDAKFRHKALSPSTWRICRGQAPDIAFCRFIELRLERSVVVNSTEPGHTVSAQCGATASLASPLRTVSTVEMLEHLHVCIAGDGTRAEANCFMHELNESFRIWRAGDCFIVERRSVPSGFFLRGSKVTG